MQRRGRCGRIESWPVARGRARRLHEMRPASLRPTHLLPRRITRGHMSTHRTPRTGRRTAAGLALLAAVALFAALPAVRQRARAEETLGPGPAPRPTSPTWPRATSREWGLRSTPVVEVVRRVREAVVNIHSERTASGPHPDDFLPVMPSQGRVNGMGTGVVLDPRGFILTNQHVVEDVHSLRVRLAD